MPTLTQYIVSKVQATGRQAQDIESVRWYDETLARWRDLEIDQARDAFDAVQVADIPNDRRSRIQVYIRATLPDFPRPQTYVYDSTLSDFVSIEEQDAAFTLSESDLTG